MPKAWCRYVDKMLMILRQSIDKHNDFFKHINSILKSIQFIMETQGKIAFLNVFVTCKEDRLDHVV